MPSPDRDLTYYIHQFTTLRTDRGPKWTAATKGRAPHKPFLLLSILDLFAEGHILTNLIEITPEIGELFADYWKIVIPERSGNMAYPFFHMKSSKFWHLVSRPGQENILAATNRVFSISQLQNMLLGARLDDELFNLLQLDESRDALRTALIQTYFAPPYHAPLMEQGQLHLQSFIYSQQLLEAAQKSLKDAPAPQDEYKPKLVRDQGFRKAVVRIYDHRCAFCGVRMLTSAGHTAVDAAHIIPWNVSQNDDVRNGMALCRLCHWTFDEGMTGVSQKYQVLLSKELRAMQNLPGHLLTVENRPILGPDDHDLWPDQAALKWHRHQVFMKG